MRPCPSSGSRTTTARPHNGSRRCSTAVARGGAGRALPALPRQLRRPRGVRGGPPPGALYLDTNSSRTPWTGTAARRRSSRSPCARSESPTTRRSSSTAAIPRGDADEKWPGVEPGRSPPRRAALILATPASTTSPARRRLRRMGSGGQPARDRRSRADAGLVVRRRDPVAPEIIGGHREAKQILSDPTVRPRQRPDMDEHIGKVSGYNYIGPPVGSPATSGATAARTRTTCSTTATWTTRCARIRRSPPTGRSRHHTRQVGRLLLGTGWRASETWFYAYLMGWQRIAVYDGGWWSGADPITTRSRSASPEDGSPRRLVSAPGQRGVRGQLKCPGGPADISKLPRGVCSTRGRPTGEDFVSPA